MNANNDQMVTMRGPYADRWRLGMVRCVGGHFTQRSTAKELARS